MAEILNLNDCIMWISIIRLDLPLPYSYHYNDVIMSTMASQITSLTVVYSTVYSDADQRKHQSSASLAFVWGIHRDRWIPRTKGQLRGKCFHLMTSSWLCNFAVCLTFVWHSTSRNKWQMKYIFCDNTRIGILVFEYINKCSDDRNFTNIFHMNNETAKNSKVFVRS